MPPEKISRNKSREPWFEVNAACSPDRELCEAMDAVEYPKIGRVKISGTAKEPVPMPILALDSNTGSTAYLDSCSQKDAD
jgi:hypothetical protein